jgi:hypothetical protein
MLEKEVFSRYGYPEVIHSDQGKQFTSKIMQDVGYMLGIRLTTTPPYNPRSNTVERSHKDLGRILKALVGKESGSWEEVLAQALFALRTTCTRPTGVMPFQLMFGREASQPLDVLFGPPPEKPRVMASKKEYVRKLQSRIHKAHAEARKRMKLAVTRQRRNYHKERHSFTIGAKVWLFTPRTPPGENRKLTRFWTGPWTIISKVNEVAYVLRPDPEWTGRVHNTTAAIDRLRLYHRPTVQGGREPEEGDDVDMEGDEFAEAIDHTDIPAQVPARLPDTDDEDKEEEEVAAAAAAEQQRVDEEREAEVLAGELDETVPQEKAGGAEGGGVPEDDVFQEASDKDPLAVNKDPFNLEDYEDVFDETINRPGGKGPAHGADRGGDPEEEARRSTRIKVNPVRLGYGDQAIADAVMDEDDRDQQEAQGARKKEKRKGGGPISSRGKKKTTRGPYPTQEKGGYREPKSSPADSDSDQGWGYGLGY